MPDSGVPNQLAHEFRIRAQQLRHLIKRGLVVISLDICLSSSLSAVCTFVSSVLLCPTIPTVNQQQLHLVYLWSVHRTVEDIFQSGPTQCARRRPHGDVATLDPGGEVLKGESHAGGSAGQRLSPTRTTSPVRSLDRSLPGLSDHRLALRLPKYHLANGNLPQSLAWTSSPLHYQECPVYYHSPHTPDRLDSVLGASISQSG